MQKFWNVIPLIVVSLISVCACKTSEPPITRDEAAEAEVYSSLINQQLAIPLSYINMGETVFIVNRTYNTTCYMCYEHISDDNLYGMASSLDKDTVNNFREENKESRALNLLLSINKPYQYIDELPPNEWGAIGHAQTGILSVTMLSRIGFNKEMDQALVYMAHLCGNECGVGVIYYLVRKGDAWQIENSINAWTS